MNSQEQDEVWQVIIGARVEVSKELLGFFCVSALTSLWYLNY